jgi:Lipocalin-like domain
MKPSEEITANFIGSWSLVTWTLTAADGQTEFPYGEDAVGYIIYAPAGRMAAHLMRRHRKPFASENRRDSTLEERSAAFLDYFSYCGPYTVQTDAQTVTHHVEACSSPNWVGTDRVRTFRFSDNSLTLYAELPDGSKHTLVWKRQ